MEKNWPLLEKVYDHIVAHPEEWEQKDWATQRYLESESGISCDTAFCFAGHAVQMACEEAEFQWTWADGSSISIANFVRLNDMNVFIEELATKELGLTSFEANQLFGPSNSLEVIRSLLDYWKSIAAIA